jgi:hypothetical protein
VFRDNWWHPRFWRWWWHNRAPLGVQIALLSLAFTLVIGAGWLAADRLTAASAGVNADVVTYTSTIERVVRVPGKAKPRAARAVEIVRTRTVRGTPASTQVRTVVQRVTVEAKPVELVKTQTDTHVVHAVRTVTRPHTTTAVATETQTQTQTETLTETQLETVTVTQTLTQTVSRRTVTQTVTVTVPTTTH